MARVLALVPDLLFGSRVESTLRAAGHEVELIADERRLRERLADAQPTRGDAPPNACTVLVVDLTRAELDGTALVRELAREGKLQRARTLGFFSHVDVHVRDRAEASGFDLVVPRSRMAREGPALVARLLAGR